MSRGVVLFGVIDNSKKARVSDRRARQTIEVRVVT